MGGEGDRTNFRRDRWGPQGPIVTRALASPRNHRGSGAVAGLR